MPSAAVIRTTTVKFQQMTGASDKTAQRFLRPADYRLNEALNAYYSTSSNQSVQSPLVEPLNAMFDGLVGAADSKDMIDIESSMAYLTDKLNINLENTEMFVVMWLLQAPSIGKITRTGYVEGWKTTGIPASHEAHAAYIKQRTADLATDTTLFKQVYRHAFIVGKEPDQKALGLENALVYWSLLFSPPGWPWKTAAHDWAALWAEFLGEKYSRSVNKDMWNQTLEFARKSVADETLAFWNEDGAWPGVVDDFVAWFHAKFGDPRGGDEME